MIYIFLKVEDISIYRHYICFGGKLEQRKPSPNASGSVATLSLFSVLH